MAREESSRYSSTPVHSTILQTLLLLLNSFSTMRRQKQKSNEKERKKKRKKKYFDSGTRRSFDAYVDRVGESIFRNLYADLCVVKTQF